MTQRHILLARLGQLQLDRQRRTAPIDPESADRAVRPENDEIVNQLGFGTRNDLRQVDRALQRLALGGGTCCER